MNSITKITQRPYNPELKIYNGFYFTGTNYDTPSKNKKKLSYSYIPSEIQVSVIARQTGNRLESIDNKYGSLVIIMNGEKSLQTMLNEYRKNNSENTCIFRGIGIILIFISLNLLIQPIITKDKSIPFLGLHTKMSALISTIIITLALSTITISIGWFLFRPERAIPLIIISILTILSLKKRKKVIIPE